MVTADVNDDGLIDIFVANDMNPNFLFLNRGDGTFDDVSEISGAAFNVNGMAQSGMGVDAEDVDGDGLPELFVTNFSNEYSTLYHNYGKGTFYDNTAFFGLASDSLPWVKWGCALADFDNDGWPDVFFVNGHVDNNRREIGQPVDYEEIPCSSTTWPQRQERFRLATRDAGPYFDTKHVGRGAAFGDIDNDGDIDIVVNHKDGAPALLRNDTKSANHWIRFILEGTKSNRDSIGAKLAVTAGGQTIYRQRKGGYSMQATNDHRVLVGVGPATTVEKAVIRWPSGRDDHPGKPQGRPGLQAGRAQDRRRDSSRPRRLAKAAPAAPTEKAKPAQLIEPGKSTRATSEQRRECPACVETRRRNNLAPNRELDSRASARSARTTLPATCALRQGRLHGVSNERRAFHLAADPIRGHQRGLGSLQAARSRLVGGDADRDGRASAIVNGVLFARSGPGRAAGARRLPALSSGQPAP